MVRAVLLIPWDESEPVSVPYFGDVVKSTYKKVVTNLLHFRSKTSPTNLSSIGTGVFSLGSMRKARTMLKMKTLDSRRAILSPRHCLGPPPNGMYVAVLMADRRSGLKRSGSNLSGSGK